MAHDAPRILAGRYEVGELIGRGGMAEVHIGHDARLGRTVAIKILRSDLARDPSFQARFRREAQAAAALNHPAIVAVYDTGEETYTEPSGAVSHVPFIVMEYVEGHTVRDILRDGSAVPIDEAIEIVSGVLSALEYSHQAGIVHRDIKPANVMLTPTGAVKVMDFGIARAIADSSATMTQTQAVIGTAQYLSPEQARGETVDARSDLYSTGCLLYELLTGRPPFTGDSPVAVAYQHVREAPVRPSLIAGDVPETLDRITLTALAKDRDARYGTAAEFRADLEAAQRGGRIAAASIGTVTAAAAAAALPETDTNATQVFTAGDAATQAFPAAAPQSGWAPTGASPARVEPSTATTATEVAPAPKSRKALLWTLVTIAVVAVAAIVAILLMGGDDDTPTTVAVPAVAGMTADEARAAVEGADLVFKASTKASNDVDKDLAIDANPPVGTAVEPGSTVTVFFSTGPDAASVPDVKDMDQAAAEAALKLAGFEIDPVRQQEVGGLVDKDKVTRTEPAAGETKAAGTAVTLFISNGQVEIPSLLKMTESEAQAAVNEVARNKVTLVIREREDTAEPGTVIDQSPKAGPVDHGTTITITLAKEIPPAKITVPSNLVGMTEQQAKDALKALGLVSKTETQASDQVVAGTVIAVSPPGNQVVDEGSTVTLFVSLGPGPELTAPPTTEAPPGDGTEEGQ